MTMKLHPFLWSLSLVLALTPTGTFANCLPRNFRGVPVPNNQDAVARFLATQSTCPPEVTAFRAGLLHSGLQLTPTMVDNRSFHNPSAGSFSFFELVSGHASFGQDVARGEVFFGHFTEIAQDGSLSLAQSTEQGNLMVELIAWDPKKGYFNFYELIGAGSAGQWFYRGDSQDILADTRLLHRQADPQHPQFGHTLRCAGCHTNGGPIMKELAAPHNDWWTEDRKLPLGDAPLASSLKAIFQNVVDAETLAQAVRTGMAKLDGSPTFAKVKAQHTLPERLRPLFCPVEVNIESDLSPSDTGNKPVQIPSGFFVDSRLATGVVTGDRNLLPTVLSRLGSQMPETENLDADHAWLTPVKAQSDISAVDDLLRDGLVDETFVTAVLATDLTNPVTSAGRCQLLKLLPLAATSGWQAQFVQTLATSSDPFAAELHANLTDDTRGPAFQKQRAANLLKACAARLNTQDTVSNGHALLNLAPLLYQRRQEVFANEISKNPLGQIFEPTFRNIFPHPRGITVTPGALELSETCEVVSVP